MRVRCTYILIRKYGGDTFLVPIAILKILFKYYAANILYKIHSYRRQFGQLNTFYSSKHISLRAYYSREITITHKPIAKANNIENRQCLCIALIICGYCFKHSQRTTITSSFGTYIHTFSLGLRRLKWRK